jgi:hypothetical protein
MGAMLIMLRPVESGLGLSEEEQAAIDFRRIAAAHPGDAEVPLLLALATALEERGKLRRESALRTDATPFRGECGPFH